MFVGRTSFHLNSGWTFLYGIGHGNLSLSVSTELCCIVVVSGDVILDALNLLDRT